MTWTEATSFRERWQLPRTGETVWDGGDTLWDMSANVSRTFWDFTDTSENFTVRSAGAQTWTEQ
jgi:hypothetical protein